MEIKDQIKPELGKVRREMGERSMESRIKNAIKYSQLMLLVVLSAGWWGILYPDLSFSEQTFTVTEQTEKEPYRDTDGQMADERSEKKELTGSEAFWALLGASPDEIEIKSRLLEQVFGNDLDDLDNMDIDNMDRGKKDEQQRAYRDF